MRQPTQLAARHAAHSAHFDSDAGTAQAQRVSRLNEEVREVRGVSRTVFLVGLSVVGASWLGRYIIYTHAGRAQRQRVSERVRSFRDELLCVRKTRNERKRQKHVSTVKITRAYDLRPLWSCVLVYSTRLTRHTIKVMNKLKTRTHEMFARIPAASVQHRQCTSRIHARQGASSHATPHAHLMHQ